MDQNLVPPQAAGHLIQTQVIETRLEGGPPPVVLAIVDRWTYIK